MFHSDPLDVCLCTQKNMRDAIATALDRAEKAESERDHAKSVMNIQGGRYWEGRYRDEKAACDTAHAAGYAQGVRDATKLVGTSNEVNAERVCRMIAALLPAEAYPHALTVTFLAGRHEGWNDALEAAANAITPAMTTGGARKAIQYLKKGPKP